MIEKIAPYWKALAGFAGPVLIGVIAAMQDDSLGGSTVTLVEWLTIAVTAFGTGGVVYAAPKNKAKV